MGPAVKICLTAWYAYSVSNQPDESESAMPNLYRGTCSACSANVLVRGDNPYAVASTGDSVWSALPQVVAWECPACDTYN